MAAAAATIAELVDVDLVAPAVHVAGGIRSVGPVRRVGGVGPGRVRSVGGPAGPVRRLDRRAGGRTGSGGEPAVGSVAVGLGRGHDGRGTGQEASGGECGRGARRAGPALYVVSNGRRW